jgi:hypothetical protein
MEEASMMKRLGLVAAACVLAACGGGSDSGSTDGGATGGAAAGGLGPDVPWASTLPSLPPAADGAPRDTQTFFPIDDGAVWRYRRESPTPAMPGPIEQGGEARMSTRVSPDDERDLEAVRETVSILDLPGANGEAAKIKHGPHAETKVHIEPKVLDVEDTIRETDAEKKTVTKLDKLKLGEDAQAETVRKMVVAMSRDIRVIELPPMTDILSLYEEQAALV